MQKNNIHWAGPLIAFLAVKLGLHFYVNGQWSFHRDELLYLALGRHLDWGYASVPAGIGFWAWLGGDVLGGSVEAVRAISTVFGTATVLLTGLMAKEMLPKDSRGGHFALILVGLAGVLSGAYLRPCMLFMPVVFDVFYWALLCWLLLQYINTQKSGWLIGLGAAAGLGLLNKYSVLICLFALLPGVLGTPLRRVLSEKKLYGAMALALLIVAPNIVWQAERQFPVVRHITELSESQFAHVSLGGFLGDQLLFFLPALPIWLAGLYFLLFTKEAARWRVFGWMYLTVLAVLLFFSAKSYYSLGAYPVLIAAGAAFLQTKAERGAPWLWAVVPLFMLLAGVVTVPLSLPLFPPEQEARFIQKMTAMPGVQGVLRWEDGRYYALPQDFADMIGWEELAEKTIETWKKLPEPSTAAIYADQYGQAGAIEHFGLKHGLPPVLSFSDNYRYWLPRRLPDNFQTLIYVNDELGDDMPLFFGQIEKIWALDMPLSRQHGNQIYLCKNPTPAFFDRMNTAFERARLHLEIDD